MTEDFDEEPEPRSGRWWFAGWLGVGVALGAVLVGFAVWYEISAGAHQTAESSRHPAILTAPPRIGTLRLATDSDTDRMLSALAAKDFDFDHTYAATYNDTEAIGRYTLIAGGTGSAVAGNRIKAVETYYAGVLAHMYASGGQSPVSVDPSPMPGIARCGEGRQAGARLVVCVWSGYNAMLAIITGGITADVAAQQLRTLLPAIVATN